MITEEIKAAKYAEGFEQGTYDRGFFERNPEIDIEYMLEREEFFFELIWLECADRNDEEGCIYAEGYIDAARQSLKEIYDATANMY